MGCKQTLSTGSWIQIGLCKVTIYSVKWQWFKTLGSEDPLEAHLVIN